MDRHNDKYSHPLPPNCTIKRSVLKVSNEISSVPSMSSMAHNMLREHNRSLSELKSRVESPHSLFRLRFSDSSSGFGSSAASLSSAFHSTQRTPSMRALLVPVHQQTTKKKERPPKAETVKEGVTSVLDQIDKRVAFLRETAAELEVEKKKLLKVLNTIASCDELSAIADVDQEEIKVTTHGLLYRLNSVDIIIKTLRSESQERALERVNAYIDKLSVSVEHDKAVAKQTCLAYLGASSSDYSGESTPTDDRFQRAIIDCAVDDQKIIRQKLENIFADLSENSKQLVNNSATNT